MGLCRSAQTLYGRIRPRALGDGRWEGHAGAATEVDNLTAGGFFGWMGREQLGAGKNMYSEKTLPLYMIGGGPAQAIGKCCRGGLCDFRGRFKYQIRSNLTFKSTVRPKITQNNYTGL